MDSLESYEKKARDKEIRKERRNEEAITKGIIFDPVETAGLIREKHSSVLSTILEIGAHLIKAKLTLPHGEYETWVKEHCALSLSTARFYAQCSRRAYHKKGEIANMRATAFASLMKLPDDIFALALEEGELEGKSIEELSKREIENYYEKLKADRDIERRKRMECEERIEKGVTQLYSAEKALAGVKKEIEKLKDPNYLSNINTEKSITLIGQTVLTLIKLSNIKIAPELAGKILSPLVIAMQGLQEKWEPKWED